MSLVLGLSSLLGLGEDKSLLAFTAVLSIGVLGHEGTTSTLGSGALSAGSGDLTAGIDLVELEDGELDLLVLVLVLLGLGVGLLFSLLGSSAES